MCCAQKGTPFVRSCIEPNVVGGILAAVVVVAAAGAQDAAPPAQEPLAPGPEIPAPAFPAPVAPIDKLRRLTPDEIASRMTGAELRGCYIDGRERNGLEPQWAERTAVDGGLYDILDADVRVGRWYAVNDAICYVYERTTRETYCFFVSEADDELYFTPVDPSQPRGAASPIATTDCKPPAVS